MKKVVLVAAPVVMAAETSSKAEKVACCHGKGKAARWSRTVKGVSRPFLALQIWLPYPPIVGEAVRGIVALSLILTTSPTFKILDIVDGSTERNC